ncbi:MAG: 4a-hydroxytetrahydrobiopterin dehydratase [Elusimicrobia bacterium]|jgi:4a-hydroxytetrahydrobiopterin dehydratase|nr:4a-hydroxytetrahydrobiopterin dehydratase [Elusimicrobiota bacterium]
MPQTIKKLSPLAAQACVPCRGGGPRVEGEDLNRLTAELGGDWRVVADRRLRKEFLFPDFRGALAFAELVGKLAEEVNHHPDLAVSWGRTVVTVWTHKIGGLSEVDFVFAAKVDALQASGRG